jgi:hypothetical protein
LGGHCGDATPRTWARPGCDYFVNE